MRRIWIFSLLMAGFSSVYAQEADTIVMKEIVVNSNRIEVPFAESSRNVHILTRDEMKDMPARSLPEYLSYVPSVDIRQRGPVGVQSDIGIRGGTFEQTLILLNGIKLTDPQTGHHIMNVPVPASHIYQLEVLKGPGARIYGQNAFAGAVNIITRIPEGKHLGINSYGGCFGSYGAEVNLTVPIGQYRQFASFSRDASDGYRTNTDYRINNFFYQSGFSAPGGELELITAYSDRKFGADGFYTLREGAEEYEEVGTSLVSLSYKAEKGNFRIKPRVYWRRNRDNYFYIRSNPEVYENLHITNTVGAEINSTLESKFGTTGFGVEFRKEMIEGDWVRGGTPSKSNLDGYSRENYGFFLDHRLSVHNRLDVTPGIYLNNNSDFGWDAFSGVDVGLKINDYFRLYGNIGSSYRVPTLYDLYYSDPGNTGNPELEPEEALTWESGMRFMKKGFLVEAGYFNRDGRKIIDWVANNEGVFEARNFQHIRAEGFEIMTTIQFDAFTHENFIIKNINLSYTAIHQKQLGDMEDVQSKYLLQYIRNQLIVGVNHKIFGKLSNDLKVRYTERYQQSPYWLIDDRLTWKENEHIEFFAEISNLLNTSYIEILKPMPGRWIRGGVSVNLSFK